MLNLSECKEREVQCQVELDLCKPYGFSEEVAEEKLAAVLKPAFPDGTGIRAEFTETS